MDELWVGADSDRDLPYEVLESIYLRSDGVADQIAFFTRAADGQLGEIFHKNGLKLVSPGSGDEEDGKTPNEPSDVID